MRRESGQALVESALTMPLLIFMILGTLQLFMMLQARIMTQYAAYKAVRAGSLNSGDCGPMVQAAVANLLPTLARTDNEAFLVTAYQQHAGNKYTPGVDGNHSGPIVEIVRESPTFAQIGAGAEDYDFDVPVVGKSPLTLEIRMLYWYRMRIPFANWVLTRIFLARAQLEAGPIANPYMLTGNTTSWSTGPADPLFDDSTYPGGNLGPRVRTWSNNGQYMFPIRVSSVMRMMTPPAGKFFLSAGCPVPP